MAVEVKYDRRAAQTAAFVILAEAWNDAVLEGITPDLVGAPTYGPDSEVLYAVSTDGDIVGVLVFATREATVALQLMYVEPSSRRQGVLKDMYMELAKRAYAMGATRLVVEVPVRGEIALAAMKKLGFEPVSISLERKSD